MEETQAARHPDEVRREYSSGFMRLVTRFIHRVLSIFELMVVSGCLEKDDTYILDHMRKFLTNEEVHHFHVAKTLLPLIKCTVCNQYHVFVPLY
jgi:hypothetical protein